MRCKECATVFSVQDAITVEGQRAPEESTAAIENEVSLAPPPLFPVSPLAQSVAHPVGSQPVAAHGSSAQQNPAQRLPVPSRPSRPPGALPAVLGRTPLAARPLSSRLGERPAAHQVPTAPGPHLAAPATRPLGSPVGSPSRLPLERPLARALPSATKPPSLVATPVTGPRGGDGQTMSVGVPPGLDPRGSLPSRLGSAGWDSGQEGLFGPVLGRGSAAGFPPVTEERTLPAVPPFHGRASLEQGSSMSTDPPLASFAAQDSPYGSAPSRISPPASAADSQPQWSQEPGHTPRFDDVGGEARSTPFSAGPWAPHDGRAEPEEAVPATREAPVLDHGSARQSEAPALNIGDRLMQPDFDAESAREPSPPTNSQRARRVVPLVAAAGFALLLGGVGFGSGYLLGSSSASQPSPAASPLVAAPDELPRHFAPPPPPPPAELEEAAEARVEPQSGSNTRTVDSPPKRSTEQRTAASERQGVSDSLSGLSMGVGPGPVAGSGAGRAGSGAGLEAAAIQSTVQKNQNAVKRSCWQPALNGRSADAPSTARVTTTLQISPSGAVTSVKHSGDPRGYPGLGACIVGRLKTWTFPTSSGTTTANIPFVFAAQ